MATFREGVLTGVVRAVGEPQGEDVGVCLSGDFDTLEEVVRSLPPYGFIWVADAAELVLWFLEEVRVDGADAQAQGLGVPFEFAVVVHLVPRDVDRHRRAYAGETVHLRRVGHLLERVAGYSLLREDGEAGARVAVAPRRGLHPLGAQSFFHPRYVHPVIGKTIGQGVVGAFVRALQSSILLRGCPACWLLR